MILPRAHDTSGRKPRRRNSWIVARAHKNWPMRLTDNTLFHCPSLMSPTDASSCTPAFGDEDVEGPKLLACHLQHRRDLPFVSDVGLVGQRVCTKLSGSPRPPFPRQPVSDVVDEDVGPRHGQAPGPQPVRSRNLHRLGPSAQPRLAVAPVPCLAPSDPRGVCRCSPALGP